MPRLRDLACAVGALALVGLGPGGTPAAGQTSTEEGEALQAMLEDLFETTSQRYLGAPWPGELTLRVEPDRYVLSTTPARIGDPTNYASVPGISLVFVPLGEDRFRTSLYVPRGWEAHTEGVVRHAGRDAHMSGVALINLGDFTFLDVDVRMTDVLYSPTSGGGILSSLRYGEGRLSRTSGQTSLGRIDQAEVHILDAVGIEVPDQGIMVSIRHSEGHVASRDLEPELLDAFLTWLDGEVLAPRSRPSSTEIATDLLARFRVFLDGGSGRFEFEDLTLVAPNGTGSLGRLAFGAKVRGLRGDLADLHVTFAFEDLRIPFEDFPARFIPTDLEVSVAVEDLPVHALAALAFDLLLTEPEPGGMVLYDPFAGVEFRVLELLSEAGTRIHLDRLLVGTTHFLLDASGTAWPDTGSAYGARYELRFDINGWDELALLFGTSGDASDIDALRRLLVEIGEPVADAARPGTLRYEYSVLADGAVLLNGRDAYELSERLGTAPH